jgi:phage tail sheath protein FI
MAVQLSYPGVYVDEVASGVHTITGVATSITAFVGRCARGPVDTPVTINSFAEFERVFGGLWTESHLGYSVSDFFRNGGSTAIIVRVHKSTNDDTRQMTLGAGSKQLKLEAASPGSWASNLVARIDGDVATGSDNTTFNLTVTDSSTQQVEVFRNISWSPGAARRADLVVNAQSSLVKVTSPLPTAAMTGLPITAAAGTATDGSPITNQEISDGGTLQATKSGMYALEKADLFNLLVIPPYKGTDDLGTRDVDSTVMTAAIAYAAARRAVAILDPPPGWNTVANAVTGVATHPASKDAVTYFPRVMQPDVLRDGQVVQFAASGGIAGVIAATDGDRGVWKAPAGLNAQLTGVTELAVSLTDLEIGQLNPLGLNCLRIAPAAGPVVWGARTRDGDDRLASEWKYLPVRRTALFLEESLYRGIQWAVFEPNDEPLWAQIRLNIGAFMNTLFRQGAFQGSSPRDAYFVKCDKDTTTQSDINLGIVNIQVGFAPLKPAEFVVLRLQQMAGQIAS